jgi:hypothetical protein
LRLLILIVDVLFDEHAYRYFDLIIIFFAKKPAKLRKTITHPGKDVGDSSVSRWSRTVGLGYVLSNLKVTTLQ